MSKERLIPFHVLMRCVHALMIINYIKCISIWNRICVTNSPIKIQHALELLFSIKVVFCLAISIYLKHSMALHDVGLYNICKVELLSPLLYWFRICT